MFNPFQSQGLLAQLLQALAAQGITLPTVTTTAPPGTAQEDAMEAAMAEALASNPAMLESETALTQVESGAVSAATLGAQSAVFGRLRVLNPCRFLSNAEIRQIVGSGAARFTSQLNRISGVTATVQTINVGCPAQRVTIVIRVTFRSGTTTVTATIRVVARIRLVAFRFRSGRIIPIALCLSNFQLSQTGLGSFPASARRQIVNAVLSTFRGIICLGIPFSIRRNL
jgi:hypothetical protein